MRRETAIDSLDVILLLAINYRQLDGSGIMQIDKINAKYPEENDI